MSKKNIFTIASIAIVAIAVIVIVVVSGKSDATVEPEITTTNAMSIKSTTAVRKTTTTTTELTTIEDTGNGGDEIWEPPAELRDQAYFDKNGQWDVFDGVAEYTINGKKDMYYFNDGIYDPTYSGLGWKNRTYNPQELYYVKAGRVDRTYTGLVVYHGSYWVVQNGAVRHDYTGILRIRDEIKDKNLDYHVEEGQVMDFKAGYEGSTYGFPFTLIDD